MAQAILTHQAAPITQDIVIAAGMLVRLAHKADASLHRAVEKAQERLLTMPWRIDQGVVEIASHSHPTETQRTDGVDCTCQTRRGVCWHRAAWHILSAIAATGLEPVPALPLPDMEAVDDAVGIVPGSAFDYLPRYGSTLGIDEDDLVTGGVDDRYADYVR